jgi:Na+/melibiose symporter-like transporter
LANSITDVVSVKTKLWFGVGAIGESVTNWIFNVLVFFYYQQIIGLSGTLAGIAVTIGIFSDAITDPLMGSISDRFRSRFGRRHPFMFVAPLPLAAAIYLIFHPPASFLDSQTALFVWFASFTVIMRICSTLFAVPHLAMGAELSDDYIQRSRVMSYNNLFTNYGTFLMHCFVWFFVFDALYAEEGGQRYQPAYEPIVFFCCTIVIVTILACAWFTRDQIPRLKMPPDDGQKFSTRRFALDMWDALQNRHYVFLLLGLFFLSVTIGTHETLSIYIATFYWELTPFQIGWLILNNVIGFHMAFFLTSATHSRFDKRWTIVATAASLSIFWSLAVTLRLFDLAPANTTWTLVAFIIGIGVFSSASGSILNISVMSALADIADEHEVNTGRRQEGIFYSARTFFAKTTNGIGHVVAGVALDYYVLMPSHAVPGELPEQTLFRLGVVEGPFAMVWGLIAACLYAGYRIDKKYHAEIQQTLLRLRAERKAAESDLAETDRSGGADPLLAD